MKMKIIELVEMLNPCPTTEREIGYNSAIISILQNSFRKDCSKEQSNVLVDTLRSQGHEHAANLMTWNLQWSKEVSLAIKEGTKLKAVKDLKGYTNLGLKESKDVVDIVALKFDASRF